MYNPALLGFVYFIFYLSLLLSSFIMIFRSVWKRDLEALPAPVLILFLSLIGLSCYQYQFLRIFAGLYGIVFAGNDFTVPD